MKNDMYASKLFIPNNSWHTFIFQWVPYKMFCCGWTSRYRHTENESADPTHPSVRIWNFLWQFICKQIQLGRINVRRGREERERKRHGLGWNSQVWLLNDEHLNSMVARYANETDCSVNVLNNLFYIESV